MSHEARACGNGGAIAASVVGGLAVGAIVGSQVDQGYYGPGYYGEQAYQPVYSNCRTEREQVVDQYGRYHCAPHSRLRLILPVRQSG